MKHFKNYKYGIGFNHVGAKAYKVTPVWRLGIHLFKCDCDVIFRICYFRSKHRTYYWQFRYQYKNSYEVNGG